MASAFDEGMALERQGMDLLRGHLYGGKPISERAKAKGVGLLQAAHAAYDRNEYLSGRDSGLLDVDAYRSRAKDRRRVEAELLSLGARTFAGPPRLNTYEEAFTIVKAPEGKGGKGRAKVAGAARVRVLDVDHAPDRIVVEVVSGSGAPVGQKLTVARSELYALRFEDETAAFEKLVRKYWPSAGAAKKKRAPVAPPAPAPVVVVLPEGYGQEEKGKRAGQLRMFNPRKPGDPDIFAIVGAKIAAREAAIDRYLAKYGEKPFQADARDGRVVMVTRDPSKPAQWRVTRFRDGEPLGHVEARTFREAAVLAVRDEGAAVPNPQAGKTGHARTLHTWLPYIVDGRPSLALKAKTDERSGAYAIRRKDSHGVVYVGESRQGHMWRTIARHFQSPETFTNPKKPGGGNSFATDRPGDYEVTWQITSKGYRSHPTSDQKALNLQAQWIREFRAKGHKLKNRDDGMSAAAYAKQYRKELAEVRAADDGDAWGGLLNPRETVTQLGLLTRLELGRGVVLAWSLRDAPVLAYDARGRLLVTYPGRVVRASTPAELKEYKRTHWGALPAGKVKDSGVAVPPWKQLGPATSITYTTRKGLDEALIDYVHPFGKRGAGLPRVVEHQCKGGCAARCGAAGSIALVGGAYTMTEHGIVG